MTVRIAKNKLTGRPLWKREVVLGHRPTGQPGVTVHLNDGYGCFTDPEKLRDFICDLGLALDHLLGEDVSSTIS